MTTNNGIQDFVKQIIARSKDAVCDVEKEYASKVRGKCIFLDNQLQVKKKIRKKKKKEMTAQRKRTSRAFLIPNEQRKYDLYLPLHRLWCEYVTSFVEGPLSSLSSRLIKADWHGSILTVIRSKNPSIIGLSGICLQEHQNTFKIITKSDIMKTLPKKGNVFTLQAGSYAVTLYGDQICCRTAERTIKKFKSGPTIEL